jgi:aminopeptidase
MGLMLQKYAKLLIDYCLEIQKGEKLYISSTTAAIPLIKEIYRYGMKKGGIIEMDLSFPDQNKIFFDHADEAQLNYIPILKDKALHEFDAYLVIKAPHNIMETQNVDASKRRTHQKAFSALNQTYFDRTATGSLKRSLCLYPTQASAQMAGMSLDEYADFVFNACRLEAEDPTKEWLAVRKRQQNLVDFLNKADKIIYRNAHTDISFSTKGRIWINSDGRTNMPSGEVFTGPIESSVNGTVHFDYPSVFMGKEVSGITLTVKDGQVIKWEAKVGEEVLDEVFSVDGSRYFGEVAIGTNYKIQRPTKNILFDEKIGGTIHMAVGQSYKQTGGKNKSSIHWDMIANMRDGGEIMVDGELVYRNGQFLNGLFSE